MRTIIKRLAGFAKAHWAPLVLVASVLALHVDLLLWAVPATGDHMIHLFKGWLMAEHMLPSGRLSGWSNMAFAGYPAGVYYPILGDLLVSATRWLSAGMLSWERAYTLAFLLLLVAMPFSVYLLTRKVAGATGAFLAGVFALGDVGDWPQGGHYSTVHWGVWPFMLGLTLTMFSVLSCERILGNRIIKMPIRFAAFCILLALTVLAHPMTVFFLGLSAPLFVIVYAATRRKELGPHIVISRAALAAGIALLMTLFWVVPWITSGFEWTLGYPNVGFGGRWLSFREMVQEMAVNDLFGHFNYVPWVLGPMGLVLGLISKKRWPVFMALLLLLAFLFTGACYQLGDEGMIAHKVQIERMAAFMKFIWFVLSGYAVDRLGHYLLAGVARLPEKFRPPRLVSFANRVRPFAGILLAVVFVAVSWEGSFRRVSTVGVLGGSLWDEIVQAETWLAKQPRGPLDRVLYHPGRLDIEDMSDGDFNALYHQHLFASGPSRTGLPKLKFGYEATVIFKNQPLHLLWKQDKRLVARLIEDPEVMENLHVRWIVSLSRWPRRPDLKEAARFGRVFVYSVEAGAAPPVRLEGAGTLQVLDFQDEYISVKVEGAGKGDRILYPIAHFYPWRAYRDGQELEVQLHDLVKGEREILMAVEAGDGVTELRYERPVIEKVANWISGLLWPAMAGAIMVLAIRRRRRTRR